MKSRSKGLFNLKKMIDNLFNEEQVEKVSSKILKSTIEKITGEISDNFYNEMSSFLFEHYDNASMEIRNKMINELCEKFIKDPKDYKYKELREKLFLENKDELTKVLTYDAIEKSVNNIIWGNLHVGQSFAWKWEECISDFVVKNISKILENVNIENKLLRKLSSLENQNASLRNRINSLDQSFHDVM